MCLRYVLPVTLDSLSIQIILRSEYDEVLNSNLEFLDRTLEKANQSNVKNEIQEDSGIKKMKVNYVPLEASIFSVRKWINIQISYIL